jgi:isoleucyl-tRNA synthetase
LHSLIQGVIGLTRTWSPPKRARAIQEFTIDESVQLACPTLAQAFWKGEMSIDKLSAYQTLHECLKPCASWLLQLHLFIAIGCTTTLIREPIRSTHGISVQGIAMRSELEERDEAWPSNQFPSALSAQTRKNPVSAALARILVPVLMNLWAPNRAVSS